MTQHLAEIARHVDEDAHAILIMDQADWHMSNQLVVPENITILPLPPKSPELNPEAPSGTCLDMIILHVAKVGGTPPTAGGDELPP